MEKKRIGILTNTSGGLYLFRRELLEELVKSNSVYVLTSDTGKVEKLQKIGCDITIIEIDRRGTNLTKDFILLKEISSFIYNNKIDYIITYTIKLNIYGGLCARLNKIPYSSNITGLGTVFEKHNILQKAVTRLYRVSLRKAKSVFFENTGNMKLFIKEKIITDEQAVLLNGAGVNLEHFSYIPYPAEDKPIRFLFIGRVMREKGIEELLSAMKRLVDEGNDCCLDVLGGLEEDYTKRIEQYVREGWLSYYGYQEDVRLFIAKCHCFVLPSYHEGMANTNLECAASGRPIITSDICGCREAVTSESGLLCIPQNAESLYQQMRQMCCYSNEKRAQMGRIGRRHVEVFFDKERVVEETIKNLGLMEERI